MLSDDVEGTSAGSNQKLIRTFSPLKMKFFIWGTFSRIKKFAPDNFFAPKFQDLRPNGNERAAKVVWASEKKIIMPYFMPEIEIFFLGDFRWSSKKK